MRTFICLPVLILVTFFLAELVPAQIPPNPTSPATWNLQRCLDYATKNNIQVNTLRLNQQTVAQDLLAAKGAKTPALSASVGNNFNNANNNAYGNGSLVNQLSSIGSYSVNSTIILWNGQLINNTIHEQELITQSAGLSVLQSLNNITLSITQAYLNILLAKENLGYVKDLVTTSTAIAKQGQQLFEAGSIAKVALLQLEAQLATDRYLQVQTENSIRQNTLALKQLLQLKPASDFDIAVTDSVVVSKQLEPLPDVEQLALTNFPDSKIGKLGVDIAAIEIKKAMAAFKPTLRANAAIGSGYSNVLINPVNPKIDYFTQTGNNFYQTLGLTLSIPILSQKINESNLEKSNIAYKQANLNLQNTELLLSQEVEQAFLNASNAIQSYEAAEAQLQAATESYRISNASFQLGAINAYDLLQQRNQYVQAVQAYTQAKYSAVLQQKIYEFYMGKPVTL